MTREVLIEQARPEHDLDRLADVMGLAFAYTREKAREWIERAGLDGFRVAHIDGEIAGGLLVLPMGQWFGGRRVSSVGIAGVAVAPEFRKCGVAAQLMTHALREARNNGTALSTLYPASFTLYRKFGYEISGTRFNAQLDPRTIELPGSDDDLIVRPVAADDEPVIEALYEKWASQHGGNIARSQYFWQRVRCWRGTPTFGFVASRGNVIEGYLYYLQGMRADVHLQYLQLMDFVATTPAAGRRLMRFLADHRSLVRNVIIPTGPNDPWLMQLPESTCKLDLEVPWMLRVVDVAAALEARGYSKGFSGELHLAIADGLLTDNAGQYVLSVEDGAGTVRAGGEGSLLMDERSLASLYTGYQSASQLYLVGRLDGPEEQRAAADAVFAGPPPWMRDIF